ncbi:MAG TPA: hypothetical protein PKV71_00380 [Calditrichia bacterium]|nr:hypothetical protein [Calditrichia bacterium]HQV30295.1 hypothetical protein [Calditrichia bacterium]
MGITFSIEDQVLFVRPDGVFGDEGAKELYRHKLTLLRGIIPSAVVCDLSAVSDFQISTELLRTLAARSCRDFVHLVETRHAVIAPQKVAFGLARMFQLLTDELPWRLQIFRDVESALAWINDLGDRDPSGDPVAKVG